MRQQLSLRVVFLCALLHKGVDSTTVPVFPTNGDTEIRQLSFLINNQLQPLPPDASPFATQEFDIHKGRCPDFTFDCDNSRIKYWCHSDLSCSKIQKCCFYNCNYVCTLSVGWWNKEMPSSSPTSSSPPPTLLE